MKLKINKQRRNHKATFMSEMETCAKNFNAENSFIIARK